MCFRRREGLRARALQAEGTAYERPRGTKARGIAREA